MLFRKRVDYTSRLIRFAGAVLALALTLPTAPFAQRREPPPGGIKLLGLYSHERLQGVDTLVGRISRPGGPVVHYDIGHLAGSVTPPESILWTRGQVVAGHPVTLTMRHTGWLVLTFEEDNANFSVQGADTISDVAEVLLMLFSYTPSVR